MVGQHITEDGFRASDLDTFKKKISLMEAKDGSLKLCQNFQFYDLK